MKTVLVYVLTCAPLVPFGWMLWKLGREWRKHRRFMAAIREVDRATAQLNKGRTMRDNLARYERCQELRCQELLEHADAIRKEKT